MKPISKLKESFKRVFKRKIRASKSQKIVLPTVTKAKKMAWKAFSEYIRRKNADSNGIVKCVTCRWWGHWTESQAGHYVDSRNNTVLYDEKLVHVQCAVCNLHKRGNKIKYSHFMAKKYCLTMDELNALDDLKFKTKPFKASNHMDIFNIYTKKLGELNGK